MAVSPSDVAAAAESIRRLLELIGTGTVEATVDERQRLEGALAALSTLLDQ